MKGSLLMIIVLVLSSFLHEVQGIRLGKSAISEGHEQKLQDKSSDNNEAVVCKDAHCSSAGTQRTRFSRAVKKTKPHHWLPTIHEDYYGPKIHDPRHH